MRILTVLAVALVVSALGSAPAVAQTITEIIDLTGDGLGNTLRKPGGIAVGPGSVYVAGGQFRNNAFKITPTGVIIILPATRRQLAAARGAGGIASRYERQEFS